MAWIAGLSPQDTPDWTYGELVAYVKAYRERSRERAKDLARIAYGHAAMIGSIFSKKSTVPKLWEAFPFWTDDEVDEIEDAITIEQLKHDLESMGVKGG